MISLITVKDFGSFFSAVHDGAQPYSWQQAVLEKLVASGDWPSLISAPTGSGKSAVIDIHVFARALAIQDGKKLPRRLALVVGRRALVDSQAEQATQLQRLLSTPGDSAILREVADLLMRDDYGYGKPLGVSVIRGGITPDRGWIDHPTLTQILCMTPDMFGSRLLHRGYGEAVRARPRSAGLLGFDTVAVIDEAHLNVQLTHTARRVGEIVSKSKLVETVPALQVVELTATPQTQTSSSVEVTEESLDANSSSDQLLGQRLRAPKTLRLHSLKTWPLPKSGKVRQSGIVEICEVVKELRARTRGTVGVILNRVADAVSVQQALSKDGFNSVLRVGPMRRLSSIEVEAKHPTLLTPEGDPKVDFLVATQTIEVGVDLDLHGMLTEIASASALIQRVGRLNRRGLLDECEVVVIGPENNTNVESAHPYVSQEITEAHEWLSRIAAEGADLSPSSISSTKVPRSHQRRLTYQRLELADIELLAHTSETLFVEPELEFWLNDDLGNKDQSIGVIGRKLPIDESFALSLLKETPPQTHEIYPATFARVRTALSKAAKQKTTIERTLALGAGTLPAGYVLSLIHI